MASSTVPVGVAAQALRYLVAGGPVNLAQLARFLSDTLLLTGEGFEPPAATPDYGVRIEALASSGLDVDELAEKLQNLAVDPVDLLLNAAWGLPLVSREERAVRVRREHRVFFEAFAPEARRVLEALEKFQEHGSTEFTAQALLVAPLNTMGNVADLTARFGGAGKLHHAWSFSFVQDGPSN